MLDYFAYNLPNKKLVTLHSACCVTQHRWWWNVKTLFFFSTKEVIIFLIPKFVTSILKSLVITAIWLALNHISINDSFHALNGIISGTSHRWHTILYHFSFGYKMKCICLLITASPANRSNKYCYFLNFVISKWL